ncbi:hypothetical protein [Aliihoeflea sp. PC F10.4]
MLNGNYALPGVNAGCIIKLLEEHLRSQQQEISDTMFAAFGGTAVKSTVIRS